MNNLGLLSTYFLEPDIPESTLSYAQKLKSHCKTLLFLTNDDRKLNPDAESRLASAGIELKYVPNQGLDFGMWSRHIDQWTLSDYSGIVLANDSCIALRAFDQTFQSASAEAVDIVGMTDSNEIDYHLQSYFLYAASPAGSEFMHGFIKRMTPELMDPKLSRESLIQRCEVGLTQAAITEGLTTKALWGNSRQRPTKENPSLVWAPIYLAAGMPVVKKKYLNCHYSSTIKVQVYNRIEHRPYLAIESLKLDNLPSDIWQYLEQGRRRLKKMRFKIARSILLRFWGLKSSYQLNSPKD